MSRAPIPPAVSLVRPVPANRSVLLAAALVALAGCSSQPAAPTAVQLVNVPGTATGGTGLEVTFHVTGPTEGVTHAEVHWGPQVPGPGVEYRSSGASPQGGGDYKVVVPVPPSGPLFLRAHVKAGDTDLLGDAVQVNVKGTGAAGFVNVQIPKQVEAGVAFEVSYRLDANGTSPHLGAHFSATSTPDMAGRAPGDWPGAMASQHLGAPAPVSLPGDFTVSVTIPSPGTWYLRPHAIVGTEQLWGGEARIVATDPAVPNVLLLKAPTQAVAGEPVPVLVQVNGPAGTATNHAGAHYGNASSANLTGGFSPAQWQGMRAAPHAAATLSQNLTVNITFPLPGTWYYRGHTIVNGQNYWSGEVAVSVAAPATPKVIITMAPKNYTYALLPGANVAPFEVEWAVLTPDSQMTNHTHLHHGPQSVPQPVEGSATNDYPASTATPKNASVPGLFKANVTALGVPTEGQPYYLRAMALVKDASGQEQSVWSDEVVVAAHLQT
jgi:hypothetical protein